MQTDITHTLPKIIADHIAACNAHNVEAWMATFSPDAMINDIQREFVGTRQSADSPTRKPSGRE